MNDKLKSLINLSSEFLSLVKLGVGEKRKAIEIQKLKENMGKYIHFSDSDRANISFNKDIHPGNPRGFYGYPLDSELIKSISNGNRNSFDDYAYKKYIYVFDVSGAILDLDNFDFNKEYSKLFSWMKNKNLIRSWMRENDQSFMDGDTDGLKLLNFIRSWVSGRIGTNQHSVINIVLREVLGYEAIKTVKGNFGDGIKSQIAVLNPTSINIIHKLENPMRLTDKEVEESNIEYEKMKEKLKNYI